MSITIRRRKRDARTRRIVERYVDIEELGFNVVATLPLRKGFPAKLVGSVGEDEARQRLQQLPRPGDIRLLYHGTPHVANWRSINRVGFRLSRYGMFGEGIYFGSTSKARNYAGNQGVVLECLVALGSVFTATSALPLGLAGYDSIHGTKAAGLLREEWCVKDAARVVVLGAYLTAVPGVKPPRNPGNYWLASYVQQRRSYNKVARRPNDPEVIKLLNKTPPPGVRRGRSY
jgi:hypothetical protein